MIESRRLNKRESALAYGLILAELIIQVVGGLFYEQMPEFFWALADAILIMVPLNICMHSCQCNHDGVHWQLHSSLHRLSPLFAVGC